jgi:endonuclease/exonuclease/phosphatase (EEP) superfamily protein YafD
VIIELPYSRQNAAAGKPASTTRDHARLLSITSCGYLLFILVTLILLREAGDRWWPATALLLAPRWPFALPLLFLWPFVLRKRRWLPVTATALASLITVGPIMGLNISPRSLGCGRGQLRLLTCNIHRQHVDVVALGDYIASIQPDIVALQGWSETGHGTLFAPDAIGNWHVRRHGELLVASRSPIVSMSPIDLPDRESAPQGQTGAATDFELSTPYGVIHLINLHLASPHTGLAAITTDGGAKLAANIVRRTLESQTIRGTADALGGAVILAGDFNTTGDSPIFRENWPVYSDAFSAAGSGFGLTYYVRSTQLRIDHILTGTRINTVRCWVGIDVGSPHRPFVADLNCR